MLLSTKAPLHGGRFHGYSAILIDLGEQPARSWSQELALVRQPPVREW